MWQHQNKIPRLPIPALEETCRKYLIQVQPLLTPAELEYTKGAVKEFLETGLFWLQA